MLNNSIKNQEINLAQEKVFESNCKEFLIEAIKSQNPVIVNYCSGSRVLKAKNTTNLSSPVETQIKSYVPVNFCIGPQLS